MSQVRVTQSINATADAVWATVGQPENISQWHPAIAASPRDGDVRRCVLANGAELVEEVLEQNDHERFYRYAITDSPLPVKDYRARISVSQQGSSCTLCWEATFEPLAPAAEVEAMIEGVMQAGIESVRESFA